MWQRLFSRVYDTLASSDMAAGWCLILSFISILLVFYRTACTLRIP